MPIRKAKEKDLSRIAEIFICNNRINYFPIFKDESYSFGELQVVSFIDNYLKKDEVFKNLYIYDDGLIRGFIQMNGTEICKLYVDPWFQGRKIGHELITFAWWNSLVQIICGHLRKMSGHLHFTGVTALRRQERENSKKGQRSILWNSKEGTDGEPICAKWKQAFVTDEIKFYC